MNYKSYLDKVFVVESSKAIIRNDRLKEQGARRDRDRRRNRMDQGVKPAWRLL